MTEPVPKIETKLDAVDFLRGMAALWVAFFHLFVQNPQLRVPSILRPIIHSGAQGVTLFFVLSAFTLTLSWDQKKGETRRILKYFLRRFFRVMPLYYLMIAIYLVFIVDINTISLHRLLVNIIPVYNLFPGEEEGIVWASWSIGVEVLFYVMFPFFMRKERSLCELIFLIAIWILFGHLVGEIIGEKVVFQNLGDLNRFRYMIILNQVAVFIFGVLLYKVFNSGTIRRVLYEGPTFWRRDFGQMLCGGGVALLYLMFVTQWTIPPSFVLALRAFLFSAIVLGFILYTPGILRFSPFQYLGRISYSLYLLHPIVVKSLSPFLIGLDELFGRSIESFPAVIAVFSFVLIFVASFFYYLFEKPFMMIGASLIRR